jgi:molybdate transport system regulatory protein
MIQQVFNMSADLSFYREDELFLGPTQIRLLKQVVKDGSINCAAKNLKMSYQHAWHLLDRLNMLSPVPIVIRQKGGKDGGGCRISPYGMKLIRTYEKKVADIIRFLEQSNSELESCFF